MLISIIVACYNQARYLSDLWASLYGGVSSLGPLPGQTFRDFEVILIDDASTDGSTEVVRAKGGICLPRNQGYPSVLNFGLDRAVGKYYMCIAADDMLYPDGLERAIDGILETRADFVYAPLQQFSYGRLGKVQRQSDYSRNVDLYCAGKLYWTHTSLPILSSRAVWQQVGGYAEIMRFSNEDTEYSFTLIEQGKVGVRLREPYYLYRKEGQGAGDNLSSTHLRHTRFRMHYLHSEYFGYPNCDLLPGVGEKTAKELSRYTFEELWGGDVALPARTRRHLEIYRTVYGVPNNGRRRLVGERSYTDVGQREGREGSSGRLHDG